MKQYFIAALRGRDLIGGGREQQLEISEENISHAITSVTKDNLVIEKGQLRHEGIRRNTSGNQRRIS